MKELLQELNEMYNEAVKDAARTAVCGNTELTGDNVFDDGYSQGYIDALERAIKTVEKSV